MRNAPDHVGDDATVIDVEARTERKIAEMRLFVLGMMFGALVIFGLGEFGHVDPIRSLGGIALFVSVVLMMPARRGKMLT